MAEARKYRICTNCVSRNRTDCDIWNGGTCRPCVEHEKERMTRPGAKARNVVCLGDLKRSAVTSGGLLGGSRLDQGRGAGMGSLGGVATPRAPLTGVQSGFSGYGQVGTGSKRSFEQSAMGHEEEPNFRSRQQEMQRRHAQELEQLSMQALGPGQIEELRAEALGWKQQWEEAESLRASAVAKLDVLTKEAAAKERRLEAKMNELSAALAQERESARYWRNKAGNAGRNAQQLRQQQVSGNATRADGKARSPAKEDDVALDLENHLLRAQIQELEREKRGYRRELGHAVPIKEEDLDDEEMEAAMVAQSNQPPTAEKTEDGLDEIPAEQTQQRPGESYPTSRRRMKDSEEHVAEQKTGQGAAVSGAFNPPTGPKAFQFNAGGAPRSFTSGSKSQPARQRPAGGTPRGTDFRPGYGRGRGGALPARDDARIGDRGRAPSASHPPAPQDMRSGAQKRRG